MSLDPIERALSSYCAELVQINADRLKLEKEEGSKSVLMSKCDSLFNRCEKIYEGLENIIASEQVSRKDPKNYLTVVKSYCEQSQKIVLLRKKYLSSAVTVVAPPKEEEKKLPQALEAAILKCWTPLTKMDLNGFRTAMMELQKQYPGVYEQINLEANAFIQVWAKGVPGVAVSNWKLTCLIAKGVETVHGRLRKSGL